MSDDPPDLDYARPTTTWTRAERRRAAASLFVCYGVPLLCVAWSWAGICWTNRWFFGEWRLGPIFAPSTGSDRYEWWFLTLPTLVSFAAPPAGLVLSLVRPLAAGRWVTIACAASLLIGSCLTSGFIFVFLGKEASP